MKPAPYPADTKTKGWSFDIDIERVQKSDTWAIAAPDVRPWLLMMWVTAWDQTPCGSLPADEAILCARLGIAKKVFEKNKAVLLRNWWLADDGRLYHDTISEQVLSMLEKRKSEAQRKLEYRLHKEAERKAKESANVPRDNHGTPNVSHGSATPPPPPPPPPINSVAKATAASGSKSPEDLTKAEIWATGREMLVSQGMPQSQCGSFLGKLFKTYDPGLLLDAVRTAAIERPADVASYLTATCQHLSGQRKHKNKQQGLEDRNDAVAEQFIREMEAAHA